MDTRLSRAQRDRSPPDWSSAPRVRSSVFSIPYWQLRYGLAIVLVVLAWASRDLLFPGAAERSPFMAFGLAVLGTAVVAGFGPGLVAALLSSVIATFFYLSPRHTLLIEEPYELLGLGLFVLEELSAAAVGALVRRSILRERAATPDGRIARFLHHAEAAIGRSADAGTHPVERLTERELEVARLLARGFTNDEIATALFVSRNTVKTHLKSVYGKLGVRTRTEAVARCLELGLLTEPDAG
jgi:DNA-binding CsgD family transcriptional regulator